MLFMLSVTNKPLMLSDVLLSVIMLGVIMLNAVAPFALNALNCQNYIKLGNLSVIERIKHYLLLL